MSKPKHNFFTKALQKIGILKYGYAVNNGFPFELREGGDKSVWFLCKFFLFKFSFKPKLVLKKNLGYYLTPEILEIYYKINPRCWEIIEHTIKQKTIAREHNFYFPKIDINDYEIPYRYFQILNFYESKTETLVEFKNNNFGGYGHLNMEIFPIIIYLSNKMNIVLSTDGLDLQKNIFESFAKVYGIKVASSNNRTAYKLIEKDLVIHKFSIKVSTIQSKYEYPNYNNICLMLNYLKTKLPKKNKRGKYIYARRKKTSSYGRILDNEIDLLRSLDKLGFEFVYPEDFSFEEQIAIFSNARIVIGVSGSALLTSIYSQQPSDVIELCPELDFRPGVWLSSLISGSNYHYFLGKSRSDKMVELKPETFTIDVDPVLEKISNIMDNDKKF